MKKSHREKPSSSRIEGRGTLFTKVASTHFWNVSKLLGISQSSRVALLHYAWDNVDDNDDDDDVCGARNASVNFINISFFLDILIAHRARRAHCKRISPAKQNTLTLIRLFIGLPLLLTVPPPCWISTFAFPFALCHFVISTRRTFLLQHIYVNLVNVDFVGRCREKKSEPRPCL